MEEEKANNSKICPKCKKEYPKNIISCDKCNITLMKKSTYNRVADSHSYKIYVCPKCQKYYYPPVPTEVCDNCMIKLISNDEYAHIKKINSKKSNVILTITFVIIIIFICGYLISIFTSPPSEPKTYICSRCDKTFTDSVNKKSIADSNYCEKCYDDVEFLEEALKQLETYD